MPAAASDSAFDVGGFANLVTWVELAQQRDWLLLEQVEGLVHPLLLTDLCRKVLRAG